MDIQSGDTRRSIGAPNENIQQFPAVDVQLVAPRSKLAEAAEARLLASGFPLPYKSHLSWFRHCGMPGDRLAIVTGEDNEVLAALGVTLKRTRAVPGHQIIEICGVSDSYGKPYCGELFGKIRDFARTTGRILRIRVEVQCRSDSARTIIDKALADLGFQRVNATHIPERTLGIDLERDTEAILSSFGSSTRHKIRKGPRHGLQVITLSDRGLGDRMNELLQETFQRTGSEYDPVDWPGIMAICDESPNLARLVGAFDGPGRSPQNLLAFALATKHGESVLYDISASTRETNIRLPLLYPIIWDQIQWAKGVHASWFDMNGITACGPDSENAMSRISSFKLGFGGSELKFGEEWVFEPSAAKAMIARMSAQAAGIVRRFL